MPVFVMNPVIKPAHALVCTALVKKGVPTDHCKWSGTIAAGCGLLLARSALLANGPASTAMVRGAGDHCSNGTRSQIAIYIYHELRCHLDPNNPSTCSP
jgi:hypothetical protein